MKTLLSVVFVVVFLIGCSQMPVVVKDNYFRFENFKRDVGQPQEYVYLMCLRKRPTYWSEPKQFLSGEHELWIKAIIRGKDTYNTEREAVANFKVTLDGGTSYMVNRKLQDDNISLWIQEVDTGLVVSNVITQELIIPRSFGSLRKKQCASSTI
jgi:hypothetical protein